MAEPRLTCDLSQLAAADRDRLREVVRRLVAAQPAVTELPHGFALTFGSDRETFGLVAEWIGYERLCCGFLQIQVTSNADGGPVVVALTAEGAKDILRAEFARLVGTVE